MATNRSNNPAMPSVAGATNDVSRGGLFSRANVANPVSGLDVNGVSISDSTIMINFTQDGGADQIVEFTLNRTSDYMMEIALPAGGGTGGSGNPITGGNVDAANRQITLTLTDGPPVVFSIGDLVTIDQLNAALVNSALTSIDQLPDVDGTDRDEGRILQVDANDRLVYVPAPTANISSASFDNSAPSTVFFADVGNLVRATATPTWVGNNLQGGVDTTVQAASITLDPATGFILRDDGAGSYTITTPTTSPPVIPPRPGTSTPIDDANIFSPNVPVTTTFTVTPGSNGGGINMVGDIGTTVVRVDPTNNRVPITPMVSLTNPTTFDVTIPADMANEEGDYEISATPIITDDNGDRIPVPLPPVTYSRFAPYFQADRDILQSDLELPLATDIVTMNEEWPGELNITENATDGSVYFAVLSRHLASDIVKARLIDRRVNPPVVQSFEPRVVHRREIRTMDSEGEVLVYNVFATVGNIGLNLFAFRNTP